MQKRLFDILFSSFMLVILSPLLAAISLGIKITSKGKIIYTQQRIGKNRKPFKIYKFRTMIEDAEKDGPRLAVKNDPRITSLGKLLRKYHLDELTQFWNVLVGDMSVVGPRPEREVYIKEIETLLPEYENIFKVRPGITSHGMINYGYASDIPQMVERAKYDLDYIDKKSAGFDFKILLSTVSTVIKGKGL